jgi:diguanylate cyclase (GGDEF)-like protein/PAS domain S-box-containing protein
MPTTIKTVGFGKSGGRVAAADRARQQLGERDRTALIAFAGVMLSFGVWILWAWVQSIIVGEPFADSLFSPSHDQMVLRLATIVMVMLGTLIAQIGYSRWFRAVERLRIERSRVEQLYANSPDAKLSLSSDLEVQFANPIAVALAGIPFESVVGESCHKALWGREELCDDCPACSVLSDGRRRERVVLDTSTGTDRWFDHLVYPVVGTDGAIESIVEVYRDITSLRVAEEALLLANSDLEDRVLERTKQLAETNEALEAEAAERERTALALVDSEERYRLLVDGSPDMVLVHRDGIIVYLNPPGAELLGLSDPADAIGRPVRELWRVASPEFDSVDIDNALATGELEGPMPVILCRRDGGFVDVELSVALLDSASGQSVQCVVRDVTERVHAQRTIERMAFYDTLTDLPNRALFNDRLSSALAKARRRSELVSVVFVDLDDFKTINDTLGHVVGDGVLRAVANRLRALLREEDTIARQSGDEFTIIARVADRDGAATLAERILESLKDSLVVDGYELHVSASVGISVYPLDGLEDIELLRNADTAMYRAKELGRNVYRLYSPEMSESAFDRLELEAALRVAVDKQQFELYYQPQIDVRSGRTVGAEALIRWHHPVHGTLSPGVFIELAEQAGYMGELGHWILRTACTTAAQWHAAGHDFGRICVNLSAREFVQQDVAANVRAALEAAHLDPSMLELEITESVAMHNIEHVLKALSELRDIGVRVAIDDFGTGYSSMSYLKRFPITTLKIAQDFMRDVHVNSHSAAIAGMVIDLCHELDLDIVAEGVEFEEQLEFLKSRGCHVIQGYLFSPPVPEEELVAGFDRFLVSEAEAV